MNPILNQVNQRNDLASALKALNGKNPNEMYNQMMKDNPKFAQFVRDNKNKSVEQIAKDYNVNPMILNLLNQR